MLQRGEEIVTKGNASLIPQAYSQVTAYHTIVDNHSASTFFFLLKKKNNFIDSN